LTGAASTLALVLGFSIIACRTDPASGRAVSALDDAGDSVWLSGPARRIVSLIPTTTEILLVGGLGGRVVGRTAWCDWPADADAIPSVGGGLSPNLEAVLGRQPDLVLLYHGGANAAAAARLRALGIAVAQLRTDRVHDIPRTARTLDRLTDAGGALERVATDFERDLRAAATSAGAPAASSRPSILLLAWSEPPVALGAAAFMSELLELAGARNAFGDVPTASAPVSLEAVVARNPAAVFLADPGTASALTRPEWRSVAAVRLGRIATPLEPALTRAGLRAPAAVRELRRHLAILARVPNRTTTLSPTKDLP
jgi:iron complex transport system substrate-binding protein